MNKEKSIFIIGLIITGILAFQFFYSIIQLFLNIDLNSELNPESRKWLFNTLILAFLLTGIGIIYNFLDRKMVSVKYLKLIKNLEDKYKKFLITANLLLLISISILLIYVIIFAFSIIFLPIGEYVKLYNPLVSVFSGFLFILLNTGLILAVIGLCLFFKVNKLEKTKINHKDE